MQCQALLRTRPGPRAGCPVRAAPAPGPRRREARPATVPAPAGRPSGRRRSSAARRARVSRRTRAAGVAGRGQVAGQFLQLDGHVRGAARCRRGGRAVQRRRGGLVGAVGRQGQVAGPLLRAGGPLREVAVQPAAGGLRAARSTGPTRTADGVNSARPPGRTRTMPATLRRAPARPGPGRRRTAAAIAATRPARRGSPGAAAAAAAAPGRGDRRERAAAGPAAARRGAASPGRSPARRTGCRPRPGGSGPAPAGGTRCRACWRNIWWMAATLSGPTCDTGDRLRGPAPTRPRRTRRSAARSAGPLGAARPPPAGTLPGRPGAAARRPGHLAEAGSSHWASSTASISGPSPREQPSSAVRPVPTARGSRSHVAGLLAQQGHAERRGAAVAAAGRTPHRGHCRSRSARPTWGSPASEAAGRQDSTCQPASRARPVGLGPQRGLADARLALDDQDKLRPGRAAARPPARPRSGQARRPCPARRRPADSPDGHLSPPPSPSGES